MDSGVRLAIFGIAASTAVLFLREAWPAMPSVIGFIGFGVCVVIAVLIILPALPNFLLVARGYIPLSEAARFTYQATIDTDLGTSARSSGEVLNSYSVWLAVVHELKLYGKRPPSNKMELIPLERIKRLLFQSDAKDLSERLFPHKMVFTSLALSRWEYMRRRKRLISGTNYEQ